MDQLSMLMFVYKQCLLVLGDVDFNEIECHSVVRRPTLKH